MSCSECIGVPYNTVHYWIKNVGEEANLKMIIKLNRLKKIDSRLPKF